MTDWSKHVFLSFNENGLTSIHINYLAVVTENVFASSLKPAASNDVIPLRFSWLRIGVIITK